MTVCRNSAVALALVAALALAAGAAGDAASRRSLLQPAPGAAAGALWQVHAGAPALCTT